MPLIESFLDNPIIYLARKTWEFSKGNRKNVILYFTLSVIGNLISLTLPLIIGIIFNTIQAEGVTRENITFLILIILVILAEEPIFWLFHGFGRVIERENSFIVKKQYKEYLLRGTMNLPLQWHTDHHSGDTIDKVEKGTNAMYSYADEGFEIIKAALRLIGSFVAIAYFSPPSGIIVTIILIISFWITIHYDKNLKQDYKTINHAENKVSAQVYDALSNITTVIILRIEKLIQKEIFKTILQPFKTYKHLIRINEIKWFLVSMTVRTQLTLTLTTYILLNYVRGETILIGTVYALYNYSEKIGSVFFDFASKYGRIVRQKTFVENAEEIAQHFKKKSATKKKLELGSWNNIEIKGLDFSYHDITNPKKKRHLDNISMTIHNGEKIAFIGESGSGKTTCMKLLRALYTPHAGTFTLDGEQIILDDLSEHITLIPQEPELFNKTIEKNITMGIPYSDTTVHDFAKMARFHHVAIRLPHKYQSLIKEKGVNLSGGEKQRLALTRGLLAGKNKPIILFDEPTSSVDTKNEHEIYQNIFKEYKKKTIISTMHRLHLLPQFDTIYYFKHGKIITSGTYKQLLQNEEFQELLKKYQRAKKK